MQDKHIYSVAEITRNIRIILEDSFPEVWVEGEVSNLRIPSSGHIYLTLKDEYASLNCVIFKTDAKRIKFELTDGLKVISFGRISVYEKTGAYQLYAEKIEPKGLGALQLAFEQLKARLAREGLFDTAHKKPLPLFPQTIGVVTSPTGAAITDILTVIERRFSGLHIILNPVRVQGEGACIEIASAIDEFNRLSLPVDVLIIARGGGSLEDLWAFNEELVARAIYNSKIPTISAIGHQTDWTIADFVADVRAPTPSAAAEMVITLKKDIIERIDVNLKRLNLAINSIIPQKSQAVDELSKALVTYARHTIAMARKSLSSFLGRLEALSPLGVLARGYTITLKLPDRELIYDAAMLKKDERVQTRLKKGTFISRVESIGA